MLPVKINLCTSTYWNVNTLHLLLIYIDYQTLMLQQQRSIRNNNLLTLLFLTFVFSTPAVTGPNCYFQKYHGSKILHLKLMIAWKQHANLFYFNRAATDLDWTLVNGCFGSVAVLIIVLSRFHNCFFYVLSKFDNYFDRATVNLNCPLNHWSFWINCHFAAIK